MKNFCTVLVFYFLISGSWAQTSKRPLTSADYDSWKSVQTSRISANGKWVSYEINPQEGDGLLIVESPETAQKITIPRGYAAQFSADASLLVAKIKPFPGECSYR